MNLRARWLFAALFVAATPVVARAQGPRAWDGGGANNKWSTVQNWVGDLFPSGFYQEYAQILNGGTALVDSDLDALPGDDGYPGAVSVSNSSVLKVVAGGKFNTNTSQGGAGIDGSATFNSGGTLTISGPTASFTSQSLTFAGGGIFNPEITGASQAAVSVAGALTAGGGTLKPTFTFSPTPQSWVIADAASISGNFNIDTTGLTAGSVLRTSVVPGGVHGQQLVLNYEKVLVLSANVDTGAVSFSSPSGTAIGITGYSITSSGNKLKPATWTTLESQLGGGWDVAGTPTSARLEELAGPKNATTQDSLTLNATPRGLGNAFAANLPFQTTPANDLSFQYVTTAGQLVQGLVQYTGLNVVNNLLLTVDPSTGVAQLKNSSTTTVKLRGYSILSSAGSLKPATGDWNSIDDQTASGIDEANGSPNHLSELVPLVNQPLVLAPGASYAMGDLFDTTKAKDLQLEFVMVPTSLDGDFNQNGIVDAADYTVWRNNFGGLYNANDYQLWKQNFGATGTSTGSAIKTGTVLYQAISAGAGAAVAVAVPEPSSLLITFVAAIGIATFTRR